MSKYNVDLDYVILEIDISREELEEIIAEADKIISENKESNENMAVAYLKKAQCGRKLYSAWQPDTIFYDNFGFLPFLPENDVIKASLEKANELSPDMPQVLMQLGIMTLCLREDNKDEAINLFNRAIQLKPDYAAAFNIRAMIFQDSMYSFGLGLNEKQEDKIEKAKNDFRNAVGDLTEALRIRPSDAVYYTNRAYFHSKLGEHKETIEDFTSAIHYASDTLRAKLETDVLIYNLRGKEYMELKEYGKAVEDYSKSLSLLTDSMPDIDDRPAVFVKDYYGDTLLLRGKAHYLAGERDKAKADCEEYINRKLNIVDAEGRKTIYKMTGVMPEDI